MGEYADDLIEAGLAGWDSEFDDPFDEARFEDVDPAELDYRESLPISCKFCGEPYLHWEMSDNGWRLFYNDGRMHKCNGYKPKKEDVTF